MSKIHAHNTTISHRSRTAWGRRSQSTINARKLGAHVVVTMRAIAEVYWLPRMIGGSASWPSRAREPQPDVRTRCNYAT
jgi:hypothetical protein